MLSAVASRISKGHGDVMRRALFAGNYPHGLSLFQTIPWTVSSPTACISHDATQRQQQIRWKHSERQIKRLFRQHPAILRVEKRQGVDRTPTPMPPPQFPPIFEPVMLSNGWSAPPGPDVAIPDYPFHVRRTKNKPNNSVGFLPVYSEFR